MRTALSLLLALTLFHLAPQAAAGPDGLVVLKSAHSVKKTLDRLEKLLKNKGIKVLARIPHHQGARAAGLKLRPTELLIFGNPRLGTPLMQARRTMAIDLPMKALAWQDRAGKVWLAYNDPAHLARRHGVTGKKAILDKMSGALRKLLGAAAR